MRRRPWYLPVLRLDRLSTLLIVYAREDEHWLQRIRSRLWWLEEYENVEIFCDQCIVPGENWDPRIRKEIGRATMAILLISKPFLKSKYVITTELPLILLAREQRGLTVLPVILGPSDFSDRPELSCIQTFNDPKKPLTDLDKEGQERKIEDLVKITAHLLLKRRS